MRRKKVVSPARRSPKTSPPPRDSTPSSRSRASGTSSNRIRCFRCLPMSSLNSKPLAEAKDPVRSRGIVRLTVLGVVGVLAVGTLLWLPPAAGQQKNTNPHGGGGADVAPPAIKTTPEDVNRF